jgi:hypothetical protein
MKGTARQLVHEFNISIDDSKMPARFTRRRGAVEHLYPELEVNRDEPESSFSAKHSTVVRQDGLETTRLRCRPEHSNSSNVWVLGNKFVEQSEEVVVLRSSAAGEEGFALIRTKEGVEGFIRAEYLSAGQQNPVASADVPTKRSRVHDRIGSVIDGDNRASKVTRSKSGRWKHGESNPSSTFSVSEDSVHPCGSGTSTNPSHTSMFSHANSVDVNIDVPGSASGPKDTLAEVSPSDSQHSLVEFIAFRLLYSFSSESQNYKQLDALTLSVLQRLCCEQGLSSSGSKPDLMSRLMDSITSAAGKQDEAHSEVFPSDSQLSLVELIASKKPINRLHLESLTTPQLRALCQPRSLKVHGCKDDLVFRLLYSFVCESQNYEQLDALSLSDLQRVCCEQGLSSSGSKPDLMSRLMGSEPKTDPRPQFDSLDLHFPVPNDVIVSATAPILLEMYTPSGIDAPSFTLVENSAPSPVRSFPPFALPPSSLSKTDAVFNQNPPGMTLSS